jgi:purine-nucleoside/S-methyl-5'-thioadenosine phosphorylase / adenosine deaminase
LPVIPPCIEPEWPAPDNVYALSTTRRGGCSEAPFDSLNLGDHVGDDARAVARNRAILSSALPTNPGIHWLSQVHGTAVVEAGQAGPMPAADAQWSRSPGAVCTVMTADCLPVLLCSLDGDVVAAAHAGWRGLMAGVLENTVAAMASRPERLLAWLGPAIGPAAFEVGAEVRDAFLASAGPADQADVRGCFVPVENRPGHYLADLYTLARVRLAQSGVTRVFGGGYCTASDSDRFFSYRRDGQTGRMASLILLR